jgi:putative PEP-CTERM system TPR-repeat lipoprotein
MSKTDTVSNSKKSALRVALFLAAAFCAVSASDVIGAPAANSPAVLQLTPEVAKLLEDADKARSAGNLGLALVQLKNAVRLAPASGEARARLGAALMDSGDAISAERELRQAWTDDGPAGIIIPTLMRAMLQRNEIKQLLTEFPEPTPGTQDTTAPDVLKVRAMALQLSGQSKEARADMDRSLALRRDVGGLITSAELAREQENLALAQSQTDEAAKLAPDSEQALVMSAKVARQSGDLKKALGIVDAFAGRMPKSAIAKALQIDLLLELKDDARAQQEVDALFRLQRNSLYGLYYRGVLLAHTKDIKGAWQQMQSLPPEFVQSQPSIALMVSSVAAASGNAAAGGAILATLVARNPNIVQARLQLAAIRLSQNNPRGAIDALSPLKSGNDAIVHALLAQAYLKLNQLNEAIASLEIANRAPDANEIVRQQLAMSWLQAGDVDDAVQGLRDIFQRDPTNANVAAALVAGLVRASKWDEALSVVDNFSKTTPKSPLGPFNRAQILIARGNLAGAQSELDKALALDPTLVPALYYRANVLATRGDNEAAKKDLEQIIAKNPTNTSAYMRLIEIGLNSGQDQAVPALFERAIKAVPKDTTPRFAQTNYLVSRGQYQEAQTVMKTVLEMSPNNPEALAIQGQIQQLQGKNADAIKTFRALTATATSSPVAYALLARALYETKDQLGAEDAAKRAVELAPDSVEMRATLINIQIGGGKGEQALATARGFATAKPGTDADILVADTLVRLNRATEGEALLEKSLRTKPDARLVLRTAQLATQIGNPQKALTMLANWASKNPNDFSMRRQYAALMMQTGNANGARKAYEALLKERPEDPIILNNLGWLLQKDDPNRALSMLSLAAKVAPRSAEVADTLGWLKYQLKDQQGALSTLQRAHEIDAKNAPISYHLALALDANGKRAEAKSLLQETLANNATFDGADDARKALARW